MSTLVYIYIYFFFACFYYHCWTFFYSSFYYCLGFFCKLWRLVYADFNFCILAFCIIYILICLVLITNICYLLTTYLLFSPGDTYTNGMLFLLHLGFEGVTEVETDPKERFASFQITTFNESSLFVPIQGI